MQAAKFINNKPLKALVFLLTLYVSAFIAFPQAFVTKGLNTAKIKIQSETEIGFEISEGLDNETVNPFNSGIAFTFVASENYVHCKCCSYSASALHALDYQHIHIYNLNCSYIFYG